MPRKKMLYTAIVIVVILFGIFLRMYKVDLLPPYRDEASIILRSFSLPSKSISFGSKIAYLIDNPFSYLLHALNLSKLSIRNYYFLTRLPGLFYGIVLLLVLILISNMLIKNDIVKIISLTLISLSTPILIHRSRLSVITIHATALYYIALAYFLVIANRRKIDFTTFVLFYTLLALVFHTYDVRVLFYIISLSIAVFLESIRLMKFKKALFLNGIGVSMLILESFILRPQYMYFLLYKKSSSSVLYITSTANINFTIALKNVLLQLDPRFLVFDGGLSFASRVQAPFEHLLTIDAAYRVNGGFGVLGYWGLSLYIILPLAILTYIKLSKKLSNSDMFSIEFFLLLTAAYIVSVSFYKYGVPHAARHLFFFAFIPIATCKIVEILLDTSKTRIKFVQTLAHMLIIFVLAASLLTIPVFTINYYRMESNPAVLYAFEEQYHKPLIIAYNTIFEFINHYGEKYVPLKISLIYCFKNHKRFVFVNARTITNYAAYYAIKYFNNYNFNMYGSDKFELIGKKYELIFWVTGAPWFEYVLSNNTKYRPPWILQSNLIVIVTEKSLHNYTIKFLSKKGFILKNIIKVNIAFLESYYSMVNVSDDVKMPSIINIYIFKNGK